MTSEEITFLGELECKTGGIFEAKNACKIFHVGSCHASVKNQNEDHLTVPRHQYNDWRLGS